MATAVVLLLAAGCDDDSGTDDTSVTADTSPTPCIDEPGDDQDADGWFDTDGDCDDCDPAVHPEAAEDGGEGPGTGNGIDDDCDGFTDEGGDEDDADGDGYTEDGGDCDDTDPETYPYAPEDGGEGPGTGNGVDNDCDGQVDEGEGDDDADGDGWVEWDGDCDDTDPARNPGEEEIPGNGIDENCDASDAGPVFNLAEAGGHLPGEEHYNNAGHVVAGAGDVDGDGLRDLLVGAPDDTVPGDAPSNTGRVHLVLGPVTGSSWLGDAQATLITDYEVEGTGKATAGAGDVNADGFADILVGAHDDHEAGTAAGATYVFLGPVSGRLDLPEADAILYGEDCRRAGSGVAGPGDLNGDGYDDVLVGSPVGNSCSSPGQAHIYFGPLSGTYAASESDITLAGKDDADFAGHYVAPAGDMNADGYLDLLVGASGGDVAGEAAGIVYLAFGPFEESIELEDSGASFTAEPDGSVGGVIAGGGDTDGDGHLDILMGGSGPGASGENINKAYLVLGPVEGTHSLADADAWFEAEVADESLGRGLALDGDFNCDGLADLLISAPRRTANHYPGKVYLFKGPVSGALTPADVDHLLVGETAGDYAGTGLAYAGDLDRDGCDDVLIGSPRNDETDSSAGKAYVVYGDESW